MKHTVKKVSQTLMPGRVYNICTVCMECDVQRHHYTHPNVNQYFYCK